MSYFHNKRYNLKKLLKLNGLLFLLWSNHCLGHSWIDTITSYPPETSNQDASISVGYIRSYQGHVDDLETYLLEQPNKMENICMDNQISRTNKDEGNGNVQDYYSSTYPMLKTCPGATLEIMYHENGHVTQDDLAPDNKPHPGSYVILWNSNSRLNDNDKDTITIANDINPSYLLAGPMNFDDGECAEAAENFIGRTGGPRPCFGNFTIPNDASQGIHQMVWVWDFPKVKGLTMYYTSCFDIEILESC